MFSEAISSISWRCRPSSPLMAAAISGSACSSVAVKNESGAEAVLALEDEGLIGEISPPPQLLRRTAVGHGWRSEGAEAGYHIRAGMAKPLRYKPEIYARYGGDDAGSSPVALRKQGSFKHQKPSSPAKAGEPVRRGFPVLSLLPLDTRSPAGACHRAAVRPTRCGR